MLRPFVERKLTSVSKELRSLREELSALGEQLQQVEDEAEDARLRSLVSETPLAVHEHREASKAAAAVRRGWEAKQKRMLKLETKQDELLDQLSEAG